jgi:hypothetical protein
MDRVYIFIHIPKTAGTSLRYHFQKYLIDQQDFIHFANKGNKMAIKNKILPFEQRPLIERNKAKVLLGHNINIDTKKLFTNKEIIETVIFRSPQEWQISRYNEYANSRILRSENYYSYDEWVKIEKIHSQFDWFLLNYCKEIQIPIDEDEKYKLINEQLAKLSHVFFVDELEQSMKYIFDDLNISDKVKKENVTGENRKRNIFIENNFTLESIDQNINKEIDLFLKIKNKNDLFIKNNRYNK